MARKNAIVSVETNGATLSFTVEGETFSINSDSLSAEVREAAMLHGLKQKISDGAALEKGATPSEKFQAMLAIRDRLAEGEWSARRGDGSGQPPRIIFAAFERWVNEMAKAKKATPPTSEQIRTVYDAKTRAEQLALRKVARIAEIMEEIKAERGATGAEVDTDDLLGELGL